MNNVDLLDEDRDIAEQKFVCLSFVSPEYIIKKKELFMFEKFVSQYNMNKSMTKFNEFLNFISAKYNINSQDIMNEYESFIALFNDKLKEEVNDDYKNFMDKNEDQLNLEFSKEHSFQTTTRGLKVRGVYPSQEEAELRCKMLRQVDENHDVYVGPVGIWLPFHPEAYKTGNVQYLEKELNELMYEKKKNEEKAKLEFDMRVKKSKLEAIKENMEKATKNNNKLSQTINEKGELISIENMNTQEKALGVNATIEEIKKELFEGDVVDEKNTDYGLSEILKNKEKNKEE